MEYFPLFWVIFIFLIIFAVGIWLSLCFWVAHIAQEKGRDYSQFFWLSFWVSPVIMAIVVAAIAPAPRTGAAATGWSGPTGLGQANPPTGQSVECPQCSGIVNIAAKKCKFCGSDISEFTERVALERREAYERRRLEDERRRVQIENARFAEREERLRVEANARAAKAAASARRKAFFRSRKFWIPMGIAVVAIGSSITAYSMWQNSVQLAEKESRAWASVSDLWTRRLTQCSANLAWLADRQVYLPDGSLAGLKTQIIFSPGKPADCIYWNLVGNPQSSSGDNGQLVAEGDKITWTKEWSNSGVARSKATAPMVKNVLAKAQKCLGQMSIWPTRDSLTFSDGKIAGDFSGLSNREALAGTMVCFGRELIGTAHMRTSRDEKTDSGYIRGNLSASRAWQVTVEGDFAHGTLTFTATRA